METIKKTVKVREILEKENSYHLVTDSGDIYYILYADYHGKFPHKPFLSKTWTFVLESFFQEVTAAEINGKTLFRKSAEKLSTGTQNLAGLYDDFVQEEKEKRALVTQELQKRLDAFIDGQTDNPQLEKDIDTLPILFRAWLKTLFFSSFEHKKLVLLFRLIQVADKVIKRHNNYDFEKWDRLKFLILRLQCDAVYDHLFHPEAAAINPSIEDEFNVSARYNECREAVRQDGLYDSQDEQNYLLLYFTMLVRKIIYFYNADMYLIRSNLCRDWHYKRCLTDEQEYIRNLNNFQLFRIEDPFFDIKASPDAVRKIFDNDKV